MANDPFAWDDAEPEPVKGLFAQRVPSEAGVRCPSHTLVQGAAMNVLPPDLQQRVSAHVDRCVVCQALRDALEDPAMSELTRAEHDRILESVRTTVGESQSRRGFIHSGVWGLAAAAALTVVAGASYAVWRSTNAAPTQTAQRIARDIHLPSAPSALRPDKAAIRVPAVNELLWRGSEAQVGAEVAALTRALEPYRADDFGGAAGALADFVARYPRSAAGHFYLGVTDLFLERDADAVVALERAARLVRNDTDLKDDVEWYLALAYLRTDQVREASVRLDILCRGRGAHAARACAALQELPSVVRSR